MESLMTQADKFLAETKNWKVLFVGGLGVLLSGIFGFFFHTYLSVGDSTFFSTLFLGWLILAVFSLQVLFLRSSRFMAAVIALESLVAGISFLSKPSLAVFASWLALGFFLWLSYQSGREHLDNLVKLNLPDFNKAVVNRAVTAFAIFAAILYASFSSLGSGYVTKVEVASFLEPTEVLFKNFFVANFSYNLSVYNLTQMVAAQKLGSEFSALPSGQKVRATNEILGQLQASAASYGINFKSSDTVVDIVFNFISKQLENLPPTIQSILPFGLGVLIFLTIKGFGSVIRWLVFPLTFFLYKLALSSGFAVKELEPQSREVIVLK